MADTVTFRGRPITELSRDELLEAVTELAHDLVLERAWQERVKAVQQVSTLLATHWPSHLARLEQIAVSSLFFDD